MPAIDDLVWFKELPAAMAGALLSGGPAIMVIFERTSSRFLPVFSGVLRLSDPVSGVDTANSPVWFAFVKNALSR
jgi:hypothetical protein